MTLLRQQSFRKPLKLNDKHYIRVPANSRTSYDIHSPIARATTCTWAWVNGLRGALVMIMRKNVCLFVGWLGVKGASTASLILRPQRHTKILLGTVNHRALDGTDKGKETAGRNP